MKWKMQFYFKANFINTIQSHHTQFWITQIVQYKNITDDKTELNAHDKL